MKFFYPLLAALPGISQAAAKAVFAHFIVGNVPSFTVSDWESDIALAQAASIDAFALNIASSDSNNAASLANAFKAAGNKGFKLFFSFDYDATGPWDQNAVISLIKQYGKDGSYWQHNGKPFVSTFEGPGQAGQWNNIKSQTGCFFIPDYSSYGPQGAANTGVVDGLFSWDAWPTGANDVSTGTDNAYKAALNGKPYMMPVSPWYYTNLPSWGKNWLWRGDNIWFDRWQQVFEMQPEYVQIISWNDYGESHYIGPLHSSQYGLFTYGGAPYNYVDNMPHDGWRQFLPYVISKYKTGSATIATEGLVSWYRLSPATSCSTGGTTGNSGLNGQQTVAPHTIVQDRVFFSALLTSSASVVVSIGGNSQAGTWSSTPSGGSGIYHGSVPFSGATGQVVVTIKRGNTVIAQMTGESITTSCNRNIENWNAWVGSAFASGAAAPNAGSSAPLTVPSIPSSQSPSAVVPLPPASQPTSATTPSSSTSGATVCVAGRYASDPNMAGLCSFSCNFGYCPAGACICTAYGTLVPEPPTTGVKGYPSAGVGCSYLGLCSYTCNHGYCPSGACSTNPAGAAEC